MKWLLETYIITLLDGTFYGYSGAMYFLNPILEMEEFYLFSRAEVTVNMADRG